MNNLQVTNAVSDGIQQRAIINQTIGARWFLGSLHHPLLLDCSCCKPSQRHLVDRYCTYSPVLPYGFPQHQKASLLIND